MAKNKGRAIISNEVQEIIRQTVDDALRAAYIRERRATSEPYKDTERRLYAYPVLLAKIQNDQKDLQELMEDGAPEKSKSITRFYKTGIRLSKEEILEGYIRDAQARLAACEHEVAAIRRALEIIQDDPYYMTVYARYVDGRRDDEIADQLMCDASTVRRNRGKLVRRIAVWLYGPGAI